jgi:hypothetical protein
VQIFTHSRKTMSHCEFIDLLEKSWLRARSYVITDEHRASLSTSLKNPGYGPEVMLLQTSIVRTKFDIYFLFNILEIP